MNLSNDQFEKLLSVIGGQRRGSFASCTAYFNGTRNSDVVETFLAAATTFKLVEHVDDEDALRSIPLILKEEAAVWWNGIKEQVTNWTDFQARIRHAFAPRRPAYQIYQDIVGVNQKEEELTEVFIAKNEPSLHSYRNQVTRNPSRLT
ncbi:activity-regulated cytoskeleton associated protein 2-like [Epargyreus clarus]|uniref:activity-regulated cytoskeleton associated protein 2-like n=1 Tax=Epargyreus clarus TaxID=520877 RepID=UPI003C2D9DF0